MKKTPSYAGRFADEYNMFVTDSETLERRLDVMRTAEAVPPSLPPPTTSTPPSLRTAVRSAT